MIAEKPVSNLFVLSRGSKIPDATASLLKDVKSFWDTCDLAKRFTMAAAAVIGLGMTVLCWWVSERIERGVVEHSAANAALQFDGFVEPRVQELATASELSATAKDGLARILYHSGPKRSIVSVTVWTTDGKVAFTKDVDVSQQADSIVDAADRFNQARSESVEDRFVVTPSGAPRLQIFAPIHETWSGRVIAFAEIQEDAQLLSESLMRVRVTTAAVVGTLSLLMIGVLFSIVRQGSRTIADQRSDLGQRVATLSRLLDDNTELRMRLQEANRRSSDTNDRALRRIGAELHDGPVQLVALALLRLEGVRRPFAATPEAPELVEVDAIEQALRDALKEIRGMSSGLSLPNLEGGSVTQAVEFAVMNHERRSRTRVKSIIAPGLPARAPMPVLACAYRFTQECLNNAVRHAGGKNQTVEARFEDGKLKLSVSDGGNGFDARAARDADKGLGLIGLRDRLESLGGTMTIDSTPGLGTKVTAEIDLNNSTHRDALAAGA